MIVFLPRAQRRPRSYACELGELTPRRNDIIDLLRPYASYLEMDDIDLEERIIVPSSASKTRWPRSTGKNRRMAGGPRGNAPSRQPSASRGGKATASRWARCRGFGRAAPCRVPFELQRVRTRRRRASGAHSFFVSTCEPRAGTASCEERRQLASRRPSSAGFWSCRSSPSGASCSSSPCPCRRRHRPPRRTRGAPSSTESGAIGPVGTSAGPRRTHAWRLSAARGPTLNHPGSARRGPAGWVRFTCRRRRRGSATLLPCLTAVRRAPRRARRRAS